MGGTGGRKHSFSVRATRFVKSNFVGGITTGNQEGVVELTSVVVLEDCLLCLVGLLGA